MFIIQAVVPATLVFIVFITAHLFVENEGSGIYLPDTNWDFDTEEVFPVPVEEIDPSLIDPETGGLLPEKYNYLKVENVFAGKIIGSERLFSLEVALLTKQSSIKLSHNLYKCKNVLNETPFLKFNLNDFKRSDLQDLAQFHIQLFDISKISKNAEDKYFLNDFDTVLAKTLYPPND